MGGNNEGATTREEGGSTLNVSEIMEAALRRQQLRRLDRSPSSASRLSRRTTRTTKDEDGDEEEEKKREDRDVNKKEEK